MSLRTWEPGTTHFKSDEPSRIDARLERDADAARQKREADAAIDARDGKRCRACSKPSDPERVGLTTRGHRAHIVYDSAQGGMEPRNRVTLCFKCHNDEHKDRLRFTEDGGPYVGIDANHPMEFWRKDADGRWYLSRREIGIHQVEKD